MSTERILTDEALGHSITARMTWLDSGLSVLLTGGERTHIGAVACAGPEGEGDLALPGHRELEVCREWASSLCRVTGGQVWVACGIHYDGLSRPGLEEVLAACGRLLDKAAAVLREERKRDTK